MTIGGRGLDSLSRVCFNGSMDTNRIPFPPQMVTRGPWGVSYETTDGKPECTVRVGTWDWNEPNEFGGRGVRHPHPVLDGVIFANSDLAHWATWLLGVVQPYTPRLLTSTDTKENAR